MQLPKGAADRIFYGLVSLPFTLLLAAAVWGLMAGWNTTGLLDGTLKFLALEVLGLFLLVFLLMLLWCIAAPAWVERLLARRGPQAIIVGFVTALVLLAVILVTSVTQR